MHSHSGNAILGFLLMTCLPVQAAAPITIAGHRIEAGSRADFDIPVAAGVDPAAVIPVSVFHGARPGPVLMISAGVHGAEYVPVLAVQKLLPMLDPASMSGTLLLVRVAHVAAFQTATVFYNPHDRKNLARVFPGSPYGTQTERIASIFTKELLNRADALIDLHGGDATESLHPFVGVYGGKVAEGQYPLAKQIGLAFGFQTVVRYSMNSTADVQGRGRSPNRQAVADGKAAILVEIGGRGGREEASVSALTVGIMNALRTLSMVPGEAPAQSPNVEWITRTVSVEPKATGIFYPLLEAGARVRKGDRAGYVTDYLGNIVDELVAPEDGLILYMPFAPPLNAGPSSPLVIGIPGMPE
jgi:predicted deacylase